MRFSLTHALKESGVAALVALVLTGPLLGLRAVDTGAQLSLEPHGWLVALAVGAVFVGRFVWVWGQQHIRLPQFFTAKPTALFREKHFMKGFVGLALILPVVISFLWPDKARYTLDTSILVLTYIMLGWGLNIVVGLAGLLDLGYVAFYAVGAYAYALLAHYFGLSFWASLPLAAIIAAVWGLVLGFPVLRLYGDYFAIVTLGFGEIIRIVLLNWASLTGGPNGISGIPRPSFFGLAEFTSKPAGNQIAFHQLFGLEYNPLQRIIFLYYLILVLALLVHVFSTRLRRMPLGRAWEALREDDIACASLGINRTMIKLAAFAISAAIGGLAGAFFATRQGFISPESFTFTESATILAIVVLGGLGNQAGVLLAALLMVAVPEIFRELAEYRMLAFGAAMVLIMIWRPQGLLSRRDPTVRLNP